MGVKKKHFVKKKHSNNPDAFVFFCKGFVEALSVVLYGKRNVAKNITAVMPSSPRSAAARSPANP